MQMYDGAAAQLPASDAVSVVFVNYGPNPV